MAVLLRPVAPTPPDFKICGVEYGSELESSDCVQAINGLPGGSAEIPFTLTRPGHPMNLPLHAEHGNCFISVEVGGPNSPPQMMIVPNRLREMASYAIEQCVILRAGMGGFVTSGISEMVHYIITQGILPEQLDIITLPRSTAFITVTVSSIRSPKSGLYSPGDTDPAIPVLIGQYMGGASGLPPESAGFRKVSSVGAKMWDMCSASMTRSGTTTWWLAYSQVLKHDEMAYECDAALGSPSVADCLQIEWSQLHSGSAGGPSDTVRVGPGAVQLLHSNTCNLVISATVAIVLSWAQIQAAVSALMNMCIQNPVAGPQGGKAYYRPPGKVTPGTMKNRQNQQLSGLNALPPHANITLFQQQEPWTNINAELKSCTLDAVLRGNPISKCKKA